MQLCKEHLKASDLDIPISSVAQKKPNICNFAARNSRAQNGCANFMGAWDSWLFLKEKLCAHFGFFLGGGGVKFQCYFYGRGNFSE